GGSGYLGTFTPTLTHDATGGSTGTVGWTFSVSDHAVDFLANDQPQTQTYTIIDTDINLASSTQLVTITITGTNAALVITSAAQTGSVTELTSVATSGNLFSVSPTASPDVYPLSLHAALPIPGGSGYLGTFTPTLTHDATGGSTGTVGWTFSVSDHAV